MVMRKNFHLRNFHPPPVCCENLHLKSQMKNLRSQKILPLAKAIFEKFTFDKTARVRWS